MTTARGDGLEMGKRGAAASAGDGSRSFPETAHAEGNRYLLTHLFDDPDGDFWMWDFRFEDLLFDFNGVTLTEAPIEVVASPQDIVNRPPNPISVTIDPVDATENDVLICKVQTDLVNDDPDYDVVRFDYAWTVDSVPVRTVTSAGFSVSSCVVDSA